MNRRDLFKVSSAVGAVALTQDSAPGQAAAAAPAASATAWKPDLLDAHQNETVIALSDLIIPATDTPGARAVGVNRYIDLFLRDGRAEDRENFLAGLSWLDGYAIRTAKRPFVRLGAAEQTKILETLSTSSDAALAPGNRFFSMVKMMTSQIYFNTEAGYRELNKNGKPSTWGDKNHSAFGAKPR